MRHRFRALLVAAVAAFAAAVIVAPDIAMAGCGGGGRHRGHNGDPGDGNGGGHRGRHHNPGGDDDGSDDNQGPRHRHGRHGGVDVGVGVDVGPDYGPGYGRGWIGPPTPACSQIARLRNDLQQLLNLRQQAETGDLFVYRNSMGHDRIYRGVNTYREQNRDRAVGESLAQGRDSVEAMRENERHYDALRDASVARIDGRISATQNRIGQLEYECQE